MYIYVTVTFEMAWLKLDKIAYMFHLFEATEIGLVYKAYHVYWSSVWKSQYSHWFTMYEYFDADYHKYVLTGLNVGKYSFVTAHPLKYYFCCH